MRDEIFKAVQQEKFLKEEIRRFAELKDNASKVARKQFTLPLAMIKENFKKYWKKLYGWSQADFGKHLYGFELQDYDEVRLAFQRVDNAIINRDEFAETIQPSIKAMEDYLEKMEAEYNKQLDIISKDYDKWMAQNGGELRFALEAAAIKGKVFEWVLGEQ